MAGQLVVASLAEDETQPVPILTLAEAWMRDHLPPCSEIVMVHGDYRTGNYLFDEESGEITAILDWELAHFGDFHEDIAWTLQRTFGCMDGDTFLASGLLERDALIARYEAATGRIVDPALLRFYEILSAFKCVVMTLATGMRAVRDSHNHQEVLLSWLAPAGYIFISELCRLLETEV